MKSKLALASFILAVIGLIIPLVLFILKNTKNFFPNLSNYILILYPILVLVTFIISIVSIFIIKNNKLEGRWMAITSLIISIVLLILIIFCILIILGLIFSDFSF